MITCAPVFFIVFSNCKTHVNQVAELVVMAEPLEKSATSQFEESSFKPSPTLLALYLSDTKSLSQYYQSRPQVANAVQEEAGAKNKKEERVIQEEVRANTINQGPVIKDQRFSTVSWTEEVHRQKETNSASLNGSGKLGGWLQSNYVSNITLTVAVWIPIRNIYHYRKLSSQRVKLQVL